MVVSTIGRVPSVKPVTHIGDRITMPCAAGVSWIITVQAVRGTVSETRKYKSLQSVSVH